MRGGAPRGEAGCRIRPEQHRALHRGLPVEGERAALHRLRARRQAGELAGGIAPEIPDGGDLRAGLRALLRTGLPAQVRRRRGGDQGATEPTDQ